MDVRRAKSQPHLIVGDLNGMPEDFQQLSEVMSKAMLHDVGAMATKAGKHVHAPTCWAEGSEAGSRRDFFLASTSALDMIQKLEVEEEGDFPTCRMARLTCGAGDLKTSAQMKVPVMEIDEWVPRNEQGASTC